MIFPCRRPTPDGERESLHRLIRDLSNRCLRQALLHLSHQQPTSLVEMHGSLFISGEADTTSPSNGPRPGTLMGEYIQLPLHLFENSCRS